MADDDDDGVMIDPVDAVDRKQESKLQLIYSSR